MQSNEQRQQFLAEWLDEVTTAMRAADQANRRRWRVDLSHCRLLAGIEHALVSLMAIADAEASYAAQKTPERN